MAQHIHALGWKKKVFVSKAGRKSGGQDWRDKDVHLVLRNPTYIGKVDFKGTLYEGEHDAIVSEALFAQVQRTLSAKSCGRGKRRGRNPEYLLQGILWCGVCGKRVTTTAGRGRNGETYRYYVCSGRKGPERCDHPRLAAKEIEDLVVARVKARCTDPLLREEIVLRMEAGRVDAAEAISEDRQAVVEEEAALHIEGRRLMDAIGKDGGGTEGRLLAGRIGEIEAHLDVLTTQRCSLDAQLRGLETAIQQVRATVNILEVFDTVWDEFKAQERQDLVHLVVERVTVNEPEGKLDLDFHDLAAPFEPLAPKPEDDKTQRDESPQGPARADVGAQSMEARPS